ncbi:uncharacterized protein LOC117314858 [Pecten maximus]|uniref:uncharacterized protein LOC117314858 n=1 Tax=Pecten maximus TaxID=6579 RepID=UPI0014585CE3|nr:uncharacterized protein LOC117314858 [Pecten maximus]
MHLLDMAEMESDPTRKQVLFDALGDEQRYQFIHTIAEEILDKYIKCVDELDNIQQRSAELDLKKNAIANMYNKEEEKYNCCYCRKRYKTTGHLTRHLQANHNWVKEVADPQSSMQDCIALYRGSFMKCALLLRDTNDAYKMADGDRITENAKFQLLLSHVGRHTKYQLWLFRFLAYIVALLSPRMSYEYKWNCTSNLHGGIGHNIPNDNLVEIQVQKIKKKIHDQGANCTYASARRAALTTQVQHEIKENIQHECHMKVSGSKRPEVSKLNDIVAMVKELQSANVMDNINGREYNAFPKFADIYSCVRINELHDWISKGKERLSYEIV